MEKPIIYDFRTQGSTEFALIDMVDLRFMIKFPNASLNIHSKIMNNPTSTNDLEIIYYKEGGEEPKQKDHDIQH